MSRQRQLALAVFIVVGLNLAVLLSFWNRFLAPSISGMFLEFACRLLGGAVPYRDFYVVVTPFYIFKTAAIVKIFGPSLMALRLVEIAYRCVLGAVLLIWLARVVRIPYALLGTLAATVLLSMDTADSLTSYHQEAIFWAMIAAFLISYVDWDRRDKIEDYLLIFGAGVSCSICFFTKQTTGGGITLALAVVIFGLSIRSFGFRGVSSRLLAYCAGWSVPAAALFCWLASKDAVGAFMRAILVDGPSAKGSLFTVFTRVLGYVGPQRNARIDFLPGAICFMILIAFITQSSRTERPSSASPWQLAAIAVVGSVSLAAGYVIGNSGVPQHGMTVELLSIYVGVFGAASLSIFYFIILVRRELTAVEKRRWILAMASFWIAYTLSWSFGGWAPMAFPSLAVVIALGMEDLSSKRGAHALRYATVAWVAVLLVVSESGKIEHPFSWGGWLAPPVRKAVASSDQPALAGIRMSPEVADFTDRLTRIIQSHSRVGDPIFIYSYQPLWYVLADRWPPTYAQVHYFDVAPDDICRGDAERIMEARPAVIVDFDSDPGFLSLGERAFRGGRRSGQRDLYEQMYRLIHADYRLEAVFSPPETTAPVKVFVRKGGL